MLGADASMELELTSPSRMVTHDSTRPGGHSQSSKRKRVASSPQPAGSSLHAPP